MPKDDRKHRSAASGLASARLSRQVQVQLGQRLRAFYEALAPGEQPVPERFIEIIERLGQSRQEKRS